MGILKKYWALILAIILLLAAVFFYFNTYSMEKRSFEAEMDQLTMMIAAIQNSIRENARYENVQDQLEERTAEVEASRLALYEHFPKEMKEEDQIMYVLYLETLFGTEISFSFSSPTPIAPLRDGAVLQGLLLTVNYETTYQGFQDMVTYLSTDSRITSLQEATMEYDAETDTAKGTLTLVLYLINSEDLEYLPPDVAEPETGKDNIFN